MLRFFLDEHLPPRLAAELARHRSKAEPVSIFHWDNGSLTGASDRTILEKIAPHGLTLVTYDLATIPRTIRDINSAGIDFAGVVFIDHATIPQGNMGALVHSLTQLYDEQDALDWKNRTVFLRQASRG